MTRSLKPYLTYSLLLHIALAAAALRLVGIGHRSGKAAVYTIDFVGGPPAVVSGAAAAPAPAAAPIQAAPAKPTAPSPEFDEFGRRRGRRAHFVLPRPSLLRGAQARNQTEASAALTHAKAATAGAGAAAAGAGVGGPGTEASADMPNFPYPWYITRVRQMLWQQWRSRMPGQAAECVVVFSLLPKGDIVDLRTEASSGDKAFDLAALAAVQDAAPYPPLPPQFREPFLKIHVTLRSGR